MPSPNGSRLTIAISAGVGPVSVYVKGGSRPLTEKTQISAVAVPLAGRNMATVLPPRTHDDVATVYAPIAAIFRLTFPAAPDPPLVLSSTTTMSLPVATGAPGVSGIVEVPEPGS